MYILVLLSSALVASVAPVPPFAPKGAAMTGADVNQDHVVTQAEWLATGRPLDDFKKIDKNSDGQASIDEYEALRGSAAKSTPMPRYKYQH